MLPGTYFSLCTIVTFTRIPYAQAARRARLEDRVVSASSIVVAVAVMAAIVMLLHHFVHR